MEILVIWLLFGIVAAVVATNKGRNGCGWFALGVLLGPFGFILSLVVAKNQPAIEKQALASGELTKCRFCAELIKAEAIKCRFCGTDLRAPTLGYRYTPAAEEFRTELQSVFAEAAQSGASSVTVRANDLHRRLGTDPANRDRMSACCTVMRGATTADDVVVTEPSSGEEGTLAIEYRIPRSER
jgi:hypothetical protein